jgi:hypothetical protein
MAFRSVLGGALRAILDSAAAKVKRDARARDCGGNVGSHPFSVEWTIKMNRSPPGKTEG